MKKLLLSITVAASFILSAPAGAMTLVDFSTNFGAALAEGDQITAFDFGGGLTGTVSTSLLGSNATGDAVILDTAGPGGPGTGVNNDPDLVSPFTNVNDGTDQRGFGNSLILQENPGTQGADDAASGGAITFTFDIPILLESLVILDGNDNGPTGGTLLLDGVFFLANLGGGDRQFEEVFPNAVVSAFTVDFAGSGAIGQFEATVVPLPAAAWLMLTALGGMGLLGWRRKRNAA